MSEERPLGETALAISSLVLGIYLIFSYLLTLFFFLPSHLGELHAVPSAVMVGKVLFYLATGLVLVLSGYWVWERREGGMRLAVLGGLMLVVYALVRPVAFRAPDEIVYDLSILTRYPGGLVFGLIGALMVIYLVRSRFEEFLAR